MRNKLKLPALALGGLVLLASLGAGGRYLLSSSTSDDGFPLMISPGGQQFEAETNYNLNALLDGTRPFTGGITGTGLTLSDLTASRLLSTDGSKVLTSVGDLTNWIAGTALQITITDDGDGSLTALIPTSPEIFTSLNIFNDSSELGATARINFRLNDSEPTPNKVTYGVIFSEIDDANIGSEDGTMRFKNMTGGSLVEFLNATGDDAFFADDVTVTGLVKSGENLDVQSIFGRARIGVVTGLSDHAAFMHYDNDAIGDYALLQDSVGQTFLNASTGKSISFGINNVEQANLSSTNFSIINDLIVTGEVGSGGAPTAPFHARGTGEMLRLEDNSATGSPFITFVQNGIRRDFIQHSDNGDQLIIASEFGDIRFRTGTDGTEADTLLLDESHNSAFFGNLAVVGNIDIVEAVGQNRDLTIDTPTGKNPSVILISGTSIWSFLHQDNFSGGDLLFRHNGTDKMELSQAGVLQIDGELDADGAGTSTIAGTLAVTGAITSNSDISLEPGTTGVFIAAGGETGVTTSNDPGVILEYVFTDGILTDVTIDAEPSQFQMLEQRVDQLEQSVERQAELIEFLLELVEVPDAA